MNTQIKKRIKRVLVLSALAFLVGAGIAYFEIRQESANVQQKGHQPLPVAGLSLNGEFSLQNQDGETVTQDSFGDRYKLIYFGFTYCPAICPTELQKISRTMDLLSDAANAIQPLFITVDPERDTVPVVKDYMSLFHPKFVGLTGSQAQIDDALSNFRVFAKKVQTPEMSDYTMDHSSYIYLMSPENELVSMYRVQDSAEYIADDIRRRLVIPAA